MNTVMMGAGAAAMVVVAIAVVMFGLYRLRLYAGYESLAPQEIKKAKKNLVKKFEDYWDEESEDQSGRNPANRKANPAEYWSVGDDSSHSASPLNNVPARL